MSKQPLQERPYRKCVGILLLNQDNHVFVAQRIDQRVEAWQMPQGGVDAGEDPKSAAYRELEEEIGTANAELLAESGDWHAYDLPADLADKVWKGRYRGQTQKWFALRFLGDDGEINIETEHPEFSEWRWVPIDNLVELAVSFKQDIYRQVVDEFRKALQI